MLLQEQIEREPEPALGETAGAAVTGRAIVGKHPGGRFAFVEILRVDGAGCDRGKDAKGETNDEKMPIQSLSPREFRRHHPAIILRRDRANSAMVNPGRLECTVWTWLW